MSYFGQVEKNPNMASLWIHAVHKFRLVFKVVLFRHQVLRLENRIKEYDLQTRCDREERTGLHATISKLNQEKDSLQIAVDDKTERAVLLENQLRAKVSLCNGYVKMSITQEHEN